MFTCSIADSRAIGLAGVNPWYVLATLFGEDVTKETSNKNSSMGEVIDRINTLLAPNASNAFNKII